MYFFSMYGILQFETLLSTRKSSSELKCIFRMKVKVNWCQTGLAKYIQFGYDEFQIIALAGYSFQIDLNIDVICLYYPRGQ